MPRNLSIISLIVIFILGSSFAASLYCFLSGKSKSFSNLKKENIDHIFIKTNFVTMGGDSYEIFEVAAENKKQFLDWFFPNYALQKDQIRPTKMSTISEIIFVLDNYESVLVSVPQQPVGMFVFWIDNKMYYRYSVREKYAFDYDWMDFVHSLKRNGRGMH